jgi:hypothetical protein
MNTPPRARMNNPRYSQKDYEMVASVLASHGADIRSDWHTVQREAIAYKFAAVFKADAPYLFNEERFLTACGVTK